MTTRAPKVETFLTHTGLAPFDPDTGAAPVSLPSMRTSTVRFKDIDSLKNAWEKRQNQQRGVVYGRIGMDTHAALEDVFTELECGVRSFLTSSGLSAVTLAMLSCLSAGDHVLIADCVYGPVREFDHAFLTRMNIQVTYFSKSSDLSTLVQANTKVIYVESPGSLLFEMLDMPALAAFANTHDLVLMTDNTWGSGYAYQPLKLGAHVSVIAGTKYIGGHSDLMLGAVVTNDLAIAEKINQCHLALGHSISADDAWLALRGVRSLPLRMKQHGQNALKMCEYFSSLPEVKCIYHPAWHQDPGHDLWKRDCTGSNGMLSIEVDLSPEKIKALVNGLTLYSIGYSWGGFESLVQWVPTANLANHVYFNGHGHDVLRLHIGLEDVQDLIDDFDQALMAARQV